MKYEDFKKYLNTIFHVADSTADTWLEWAEELEKCDSSDGELPKGTYKTADVFLGEFANCIRMIQETHGNEIAAKVISLADIPACPFPWEMRLAGEHLANGGSINDIPNMLIEGTLEAEYDSPSMQM